MDTSNNSLTALQLDEAISLLESTGSLLLNEVRQGAANRARLLAARSQPSLTLDTPLHLTVRDDSACTCEAQITRWGNISSAPGYHSKKAIFPPGFSVNFPNLIMVISTSSTLASTCPLFESVSTPSTSPSSPATVSYVYHRKVVMKASVAQSPLVPGGLEKGPLFCLSLDSGEELAVASTPKGAWDMLWNKQSDILYNICNKPIDDGKGGTAQPLCSIPTQAASKDFRMSFFIQNTADQATKDGAMEVVHDKDETVAMDSNENKASPINSSATVAADANLQTPIVLPSSLSRGNMLELRPGLVPHALLCFTLEVSDVVERIEIMPRSELCSSYVFRRAEDARQGLLQSFESIKDDWKVALEPKTKLDQAIIKERYRYEIELEKKMEGVPLGKPASNATLHETLVRIESPVFDTELISSPIDADIIMALWEFLVASNKIIGDITFSLNEIINSVVPPKADVKVSLSQIVFDEVCCLLTGMLLQEAKLATQSTSESIWQRLLLCKPLNIITWPVVAQTLIQSLTSPLPSPDTVYMSIQSKYSNDMTLQRDIICVVFNHPFVRGLVKQASRIRGGGRQ